MKRFAGVLGVAVALAAGVPQMSVAEGLTLSGSSRSRLAMFKQQTALLDGRLATQYNSSDRLRPEVKAGKESDGPLPRYRGNYKGVYLETAKAAAREHGVPEDLFLRLIQQESGWNPGAVSVKGATGLAQLMPDTANHLGVDINDPEENLNGGARYLRMMYDRFGSWRLALAAYNAGPQAVENAGGVPDYEETITYVAAILD